MKDKTALAKGWLTKAESDLKTLKTLIENDGPFDTACFHAQQAVERCLKAFLAFYEKKIPKIHDLEELQHQCLEITKIKELQEAVSRFKTKNKAIKTNPNQTIILMLSNHFTLSPPFQYATI